jgi:hypothetical protein
MQRSTASAAEARLTRKQVGWLAAAAVAAAGIYLLAAHRAGPGFPLDDSWIHLTYARNLAETGEWAFLAGQPSAASTAPLWTVLLTPGLLLRLGPYLWTYALGVACLIGIGAVSEQIARQQVPGYRAALPWVGLVMVSEWHFVWAAVSGMETLLFILVTLTVLGMVMRGSRNFVGQGVLIGLSVWVRPDGLTLLLPAAMAAALTAEPTRERLKSVLLVSLGLSAVILPYFLMNLALSGTPFPNTLYAKLAEYAPWRSSPLAGRLENFSLIYLAGIGLALLLAVVLGASASARHRHWGRLLVLAWAVGYAAMYGSLLPPYHNGRYLLPSIAAYLLFGLIFLVEWLPSAQSHRLRLLRFAWLTATAVLGGIFFLYGASNYSSNVALIQDEMVASAIWIAGNLPPGELVAAHDIGALGYFAPGTRLIDLAGLLSPEVVPFITDEAALADYAREHGARYVVLVPHHYPLLATIGRPVFTATNPADDSLDQAMIVYRWPSP